jgi:autotransporter-associated beta strand protein
MALVSFSGTASAGDALITLEGGLNREALGAQLTFDLNSTAGNSTLVAMNGPALESGARISFLSDSLGGTARLEILGPGAGSGLLVIDEHNSPGVSVGSIEGGGQVILGRNNLRVGTNNLSTTFLGTVVDGENGSGGSLSKTGTGTLTLSGANTYTGGTIVSQGALLVANTSGSATGTGAVDVTSGTLGWSGIISRRAHDRRGSERGSRTRFRQQEASYTYPSEQCYSASRRHLYLQFQSKRQRGANRSVDCERGHNQRGEDQAQGKDAGNLGPRVDPDRH